MMDVAFKMLIGNRAAFIGVIFGIFLAILLISQQSAIFLGLLSRSYRMVTEISEPNIWVIDPATNGEDLIRAMPRDYLGYVKGVPNVEWAVPVNYAQSVLSTQYGDFKVAEIYGLDDETLVGAPQLLEGQLEDLRREGGIVIDSLSANDLLATKGADGTKVPIKIGDQVEINGHRALVVGIGKTTPGFFPQPIIFTTSSQFQQFSGSNKVQYIAARAKGDVDKVIEKINSHPNVLALTKEDLSKRMANHFLKTGILINFGISVLLGLIIGFSIAGQIFYVMTIHHLSYFALIKALGGTEKMVLEIILFQVAIVGVIGYILGTGVTLLWGYAIRHTTLAFDFPWQLLLLTGLLTVIICLFTALLSIKKVLRLDPQLLMQTT